MPKLTSQSFDNFDFKKSQCAKREQTRIDKMSHETSKKELRDQYHRNYYNEVVQFEKRRAELGSLKAMEKDLAKRELKQVTNQRIESIKVDMEGKEQAKLAYLRNEANKRNLESMYKFKENEFKEANRMLYKKLEQDKRNQMYHDKLLVEEGFRKSQQLKASKAYKKSHK